MNYFVIMADGSRYGPTDIAGLNGWAREGRILPETRIEDESNGRVVLAREVPGLILEASPSWSQPPQGYYRAPYAPASNPGQGELTAAWVLGAVTFVSCCPILPGIGLWMANKALAAGNPGAQAAKVFNIVILVLTSLFYVVYFGAIVIVGLSGGFD